MITTRLLTLFLLPILMGQCLLAADLQLVETDDSIRISQRGKPILEYVKTARKVPEGLAPHYARSGYIHPVYSPTGQEITGDYPQDHAHQHALFFAWTKASFAGQEVDFWNQAKQQAGIEFRGISEVTRAEKHVSFSAKHAFTVGRGDNKVDAIIEHWTVTVYQTPDDRFVFDIQSVQQCAGETPLVLKQYRYGGMAIRGNIQWLLDKQATDRNPNGFRFLTSEGKDRLQGNHTQPNWVAMSGRIDGQPVSLAVLCSAENFRAPQTVRLHPSKPYFCFAPMVDGEFTIQPGQKYVSRYRYLVTSEAANPKAIDQHWNLYTGQR
ncbi:MAG: hypothetical protein CBB71_12995 [Rhodopirellula sp. TMED11]|nr:MAG: hypothetical protein CBB71_12995 [Rhodopirellula sp. TMED11]